MKRILVTGGAGFIGSNFIKYFLKHITCEILVNLDALTYAGNLENLRAIEGDPRHIFVQADIRDTERIAALMEEYDAQYPGYGFASNKGYGSEGHMEAIRQKGLTPLHRRSFCTAFTQESLF